MDWRGERQMARGKRSETPGMEKVRVRFEQWRQARQSKTAIPEELWTAAVELARDVKESGELPQHCTWMAEN